VKGAATVRTIIWVFISMLVGVMAVDGLGISSRHSARQGVPADFEIQPGLVNNDSGDRGGMEPPRDAR
jgi:hypothetical protein